MSSILAAKKRRYLIYVVALLLSTHECVVANQGQVVFPALPPLLNDIASSDNPKDGKKIGKVIVQFILSCFRTNLRAVANPIGPTACLDIGVNLAGRPLISIRVPATIIAPAPAGYTNPTCANYDYTPGTRGNGWDNVGYLPDATASNSWSRSPSRYLLSARTNMIVSTMHVDADGHYSIHNIPNELTGVSVSQIGLGTGNYNAFGNDGPVTAYVGAQMGDGGTVVVHLSLPGAAYPGQGGGTNGTEWGFCGGFYSPLMLFFDDKRPQFTAKTHFPVVPGVDTVYWPEAKSPGFFLALDRNGDGKITSGQELFGATDDNANGFEALRKLDTNHDGVIDAKDAAFKKLVLWRDLNGNGVSEKSEMVPLSAQGVVAIRLDYANKQLKQMGHRAELRETATFVYLDAKTGKRKNGQIVDVWLEPASEATTRTAYVPETGPILPAE